MKQFIFRKRILIPAFLLVLVFAGPRKSYPEFNAEIPAFSLPLTELDEYIAAEEAMVKKMRPNNQGRIIWADSIRRTQYSIVYLHGFSAGPMEAEPLHREFAQRYGCNIYISRLSGHGIDDIDSFKDLTPKDLIDSAKEAVSIGRLLGEKVILMATSTGGTLAVYLAAQHPEAFAGLILYSPNIDIDSRLSELLVWPWGSQLAGLIEGEHRSFSLPEAAMPYWTTTYHVEGVVALKYLIKETMTTENFNKIHQPLFLGYYYKNEEEHDRVVSVDAMKSFFGEVRTPAKEKRMIAFPDVATHVIANGIQSKDLESVRRETYKFAEEVLRLSPVNIK